MAFEFAPSEFAPVCSIGDRGNLRIASFSLVVTEHVPSGTLAMIPPPREGETQEEQAARSVILRGLDP